MSIMKKILDMMNMEKRNKEQVVIEEKEDNLYWDDFWKKSDDSDKNRKSRSGEGTRAYQYILFSGSIDTSYIIGSRQDFMRRDYTIDPLYYTSCQYLHKLWKHSNDLTKIVKNKKFFETLEEFENLIYRNGNYIYGKLNIELERRYYESKKDELLIGFLDKSFTEEYRNALELKTPKGRIARIDHWFMVMNYYKKYLTPNALTVLEALEMKWTGELMPNLLEQND